ncbi:MAG: glycoside hydrolase family 43 protein [Acidobacteriota bacterium]|jgi:beta-xylosidase
MRRREFDEGGEIAADTRPGPELRMSRRGLARRLLTGAVGIMSAASFSPARAWGGARAATAKRGSFEPGTQTPRSGNPILPGWYADPEAHVFDGRYWIYPTYSAPYDEQLFMDAFSSSDLVTWDKHPRALDAARISWARRALWAPSIVEKDGAYYLFFSANDIQSDDEFGGLGVARASRPEGPFDDLLGRPLIDRFHNGAQPIDPNVFRDADGTHYLIYGGWRHCNIARLEDDFSGFVPFADGTTFREITPDGYVEGSFMLLKDGRYYFMWSEGGWTGPNYAVAYAVADSPLGPFERVGRILQQDPAVATGAGHHSVLHASGAERWYIVYHRRPLGETDRNHRVVCVDEMRFDDEGLIEPVRITFEGVERDALVPGQGRGRETPTAGRRRA